MSPSYLTVAAPATGQLEVKRSRFIAQVRRVADERTARELVDEARREMWDARHHCSAFVLGSRGEIARSNDDGEPAGTAGAPILQAILGRGLSDVVVVVTRYFGGTLLGAGGLVRAYGDAAARGLEAAGVVRREPATRGEIEVEPAVAGKLDNAVRSAGFDVLEVQYAATARLVVQAETARWEDLERTVAEATQGAASATISGTSWIDVPID